MPRRKSKHRAKTIIRLGNYYNLHTGYHGAFLENSNQNFVFKTTKPRIMCYLLAGKGKKFHPIKNPFYFEVHKYPNDSSCIQSAFFPVSNRVPWVVDMDDICLPLFGNTCFNKNLIRKLYRNYLKNPLYKATFLARIRPYLSPYCRAILFHEMKGIKKAIYYFNDFNILDTYEVRGFLDKIILAYPVQKPLIKKSKLRNTRTVLFMGRDFETKGGQIALAVFQKVYDYDPNINLIYCGPVPVAYKRYYAKLLKKIRVVENIDHEQALSLLKNSDIYFSPTQFEALGITFIEAKAAGCIPVTYYGENLEAMTEIIVNNRSGILIEKSKGKTHEKNDVKKFFKAITKIIYDDNSLIKMKMRGLDEIENGKFSFRRRIELLKKIFRCKKNGKRENNIVDLSEYKCLSYSAKQFNKIIWDYRRTHKIPRRLLVSG